MTTSSHLEKGKQHFVLYALKNYIDANTLNHSRSIDPSLQQHTALHTQTV